LPKVSVFWFRRDLRTEDNIALAHALASHQPVLPIFIFDTRIISELPKDDPRVTFIYTQLEKIHAQFAASGSALLVLKGDPERVWQRLVTEWNIAGVYANKDYEPYARERDARIKSLLSKSGIDFHLTKDQVIFEEDEVTKSDGKAYTVFTPYKKRWLEKFGAGVFSTLPMHGSGQFYTHSARFPSLGELGFKSSALHVGPFDLTRIDRYAALRDYPGADATTRLSPHLRFGTISIRKLVSAIPPESDTFLGELIWREFFMQILYHFPKVVTGNFHPRYDGIRWRNDESEFIAWCRGETGYPMVDAGMRQLNSTGTMHNRVRMVTASFLCKHLLVDWRWGEAYFAGKLLDYELSSNNGNRQWVAGTGCDAAPYFRVFNPQEQQKRFDPELEYVRKWVPEYGTPSYRDPIVDHRFARERALEVYKQGIADR
jgi:deoxyribodipyrimidine photo-lyase